MYNIYIYIYTHSHVPCTVFPIPGDLISGHGHQHGRFVRRFVGGTESGAQWQGHFGGGALGDELEEGLLVGRFSNVVGGYNGMQLAPAIFLGMDAANSNYL